MQVFLYIERVASLIQTAVMRMHVFVVHAGTRLLATGEGAVLRCKYRMGRCLFVCPGVRCFVSDDFYSISTENDLNSNINNVCCVFDGS